jgi:hypothetical protein
MGVESLTRASVLGVIAFGVSGCWAMTGQGSEAPSLEAWDVEERVGLPDPAPGDRTSSEPTEVVFRASNTSVALIGDARSPRRVVCQGREPCAVMLAPGSHRLGIFSEHTDPKPAAELWLDVDRRPMQVDVSRPAVGLAYGGITLLALGLVGILVGGVGGETGADETRSDLLLYGGIGAQLLGLSFALIYYTSGQGSVEVSPRTSAPASGGGAAGRNP